MELDLPRSSYRWWARLRVSRRRLTPLSTIYTESGSARQSPFTCTVQGSAGPCSVQSMCPSEHCRATSCSLTQYSIWSSWPHCRQVAPGQPDQRWKFLATDEHVVVVALTDAGGSDADELGGFLKFLKISGVLVRAPAVNAV